MEPVLESVTGFLRDRLTDRQESIASLEMELESMQNRLHGLKLEAESLEEKLSSSSFQEEMKLLFELPDVEEVSYEDGRLLVTTRTLYSYLDQEIGGRRLFGSYTIIIPIDGGTSVRIEPASDNFSHQDRWHPHVGPSGDPCWGDASEVVSEMLYNLRFGSVAAFVIDFLKSVDPNDSWGRDVVFWPFENGYVPEVCYECGLIECECCPGCGRIDCICCPFCSAEPCECPEEPEVDELGDRVEFRWTSNWGERQGGSYLVYTLLYMDQCPICWWTLAVAADGSSRCESDDRNNPHLVRDPNENKLVILGRPLEVTDDVSLAWKWIRESGFPNLSIDKLHLYSRTTNCPICGAGLSHFADVAQCSARSAHFSRVNYNRTYSFGFLGFLGKEVMFTERGESGT